MKFEESIENWFLTSEKPIFPKNNKDYIANYNVIKKNIASNIHKEIKAIVQGFDPDVYLTEHGISHIDSVIEKISAILNNSKIELSYYEVFILLSAVQLHDVGHIISGRKNHAKDVIDIIEKYIPDIILDSIERKYIYQIIKTHSGKNDPIGDLDKDVRCFSLDVRLRLLAALLRLADELSDDYTRSSIFLLELGKIPENSIIYHEYSKCLNSTNVDIKAHTFCMHFFMNENYITHQFKNEDMNDVYIIDEIIKRTYKTFIECLYCNRFLPDELRITTITVLLEYSSSSTHDTIWRYEYKFMETGYPTVKNDDIYEVCKELKMTNGIKIDGNYVYTEFCKSIPNVK